MFYEHWEMHLSGQVILNILSGFSIQAGVGLTLQMLEPVLAFPFSSFLIFVYIILVVVGLSTRLVGHSSVVVFLISIS